MKKLFVRPTTLLFLGIFFTGYLFLLPKTVDAISITPSSGNIQPGYNLNLTVVASSVPSDSSTMQLNLSVAGTCSIVNYTPPSGGTWGLTIPLCAGGVSFTSNSVCIALSKSSPNLISNGESLGTIVANCTSQGSLIVSSTSGSGYVSGGVLQERIGTLGTFSVSGSIPNTAISSVDIFSIVGLVSIVFGIFLYIRVKSEKKVKF